MTQTFRFAAWQFVFGVMLAFAAPAMAVDVPHLVVDNPGPNEEYAAGARIVIAGKVEPALRSDVEIRVFHESRTGELSLLCGVTVAQDRKGSFRVTLAPPESGWQPGNLLIEARLVDLQQSLEQRRIKIVADNPPRVAERRNRMPASSGVVIDTARQQQATVEAGKSFLVRGSFRAVPRPGRIEGPFVTSKILQNFGRNPVIMQSGHTQSLVQEHDRFGFELQIVAPTELGNYLQTLEVRLDPESERKGLPPARWEIDLKVVAPRPKPQA